MIGVGQPPGFTQAKRMKGTINWYIAERGFGFIKPDAGGADLFVHIKAFPLGIIPVAGMRVSYEAAVNARTGKLEAVSVQMLGW